MISQYLNFTVEPVIMSERSAVGVEWGDYKNGSWTGALGAIDRGDIDTACLMYQPTYFRSLYFDFSIPVVTARPMFIVKEPAETFQDYMVKVFKTFETQVWAMFLVVICIQVIVMIICYWLEAEVMNINVFRPLSTVWHLFRFFIIQPCGKYRRRTYGGNTLMCCCSIATLLFTSLYQGLLLTRLLDPPETVPFTTPKEMIQSLVDKKYSLITNYKSNWFFDELANSNWSYFADLRQAISDNPITYVNTVEEALDAVETGPYIYPTQEDSNTLFKAVRRCSLIVVDNNILGLFVSFAFRKGSPLRKEWNKATIATQEFHVKMYNKYMRDGGYGANDEKCNIDLTPTKKLGNGLSLFDLLGAVILIGIGYFVGFIAIFVEFFTTRKHKIT